jgi:pimeloyl-ACP methyl ester carboxylesterase
VHSFTRDGLTFDVTDDGPAHGRVVIALHGFPEDRRCWDRLVPELTVSGYRVLVPDQRGYSPEARPRGRRSYALSELAADILALADVAGADSFDVIGHDWGAIVAWELAARHPQRVRTLTALSVPHPRAFAESIVRSSQLVHSWYMLAFQIPWLPEWLLRAGGPERAVALLEKDGLDPGSARRYALRMQEPAEMTGPINWYRALPLSLGHPIPDVERPTLLVWGEHDRYVTRSAVGRCGRHVSGPYRFEALPGATHWLPSGAANQIAPLILEHLASHPG